MGTLAAGIKEIFATAKTTGSNVMLCGNDGTPDGHMTMANLASVLGDSNVNINSTSPSEIRKAGIYWVNVGASPEYIRAEYPRSSSVDILIVLTTHNVSSILHTCQIDINNYGDCFLRVAYGSDAPFSNWKKLT